MSIIAQTLKSLFGKPKNSRVCDSIIFTIKEWKNSKKKVLRDIQSKFNNEKLIIRSSALKEDGLYASMVGTFDS